MPESDGDPLLQSLTRDECLAYLAGARIGRVGLNCQALPMIWPVRFSLATEDVVFRAPANSRLRAAATDAIVVFQADDHGEDTGLGWTVQAQGHCKEVVDPSEVRVLEQLPLPAWRSQPPGDRFLRLPLTRVTGERIYW